MKIVFVCDTMGSGGAERVISILSNKFVEKGHEVSIMMLYEKATHSFYELNSKIELSCLSDKKLNFFKKAKKLKKKILEKNPDVVISFLSYVCIYTWWALKNTETPYIVSERNDPNHRNKIKQFLLNRSFKKASGCVFQTEDARDWYKGIAKDKSTVIYNPVNLSYTPKSVIERKRQILYVGRFEKQKNVAMLIDAFSIFQTNHPNYVLKMFGDGSLKEELLGKIKQIGLENSAMLFGNSKSWQTDESDSALFVLPSEFEGMPNVLSEALCLGIPSVSTNCPIGGPKELKKLFPDQLILSDDMTANGFALAMEKGLSIQSTESKIPTELNADTIAEKWINFINNVKYK